MKRNEALEILRGCKPMLRERFGIERIGVFGSTARDEAQEQSDVDVVVEMEPDLFLMVHVKEVLEEAFDAPVDLVRQQPRMNDLLKRRIESEAVYA